jgi:opacity protein-like surface antigen
MNRLRAGMSAGGVLLLVALCGPFSAPPVHAQQLAAPPPNKALVFIFRSDREPRAALVPVTVNAEHAGDMANGAFLVATVDPGRTFLRAGDRVLTSLRLETAAGQSYFVQLEAIHGMTVVHAEMRQVSEAEGRGWLAQGRLAGDMPAAAAAAAPGALQPRAVVEPAAAPAAPQARAPAESGGGWEMAVIARGGTFKMAEPKQVAGGVPITFKAASRPVAGIEVEGRSESGFAAGSEIFYYKNDVVLDGTTLSGQQEAAAIMVNAKYYFRAANWFYPYVGAGVGSAAARYGGDLTGKASGMAFQGLAGIELRFGNVGLNVQYKYLSSTIEDDVGVKVKVSGKGVLGGLSIIF